MASRDNGFFKHVGGPEFANPLNYLYALPVLLFGGVAAGTGISAPTNALTYGLINLITLTFVALLLLGFYRWRLHSGSNLPFSLIVAFAALLGFAKAASTAWLAFLIGLESDFQNSLGIRATGSIVASVLVVGSIAILKGIQEALIEDRDHLLALKLRRLFSERLGNALRQIDLAIEELQSEGSAKTQRVKVLEKLQLLNEKEVRPLAHSIWSDQTGHVMFSSKRLFLDSIYFQKQSVVAMATITLLVTPGLAQFSTWSQEQIVALGIVILGVVATFGVGNLVRNLVPQKRFLARWLAVMLLGSALLNAGSQLVANGQLDDNYLFDAISSFIFFSSLGPALSAVSAFFRKGSEVRSELKAESENKEPEGHLGEDFLRNVASAIHGKLQNRITLAMARISDGAELETELREIRNLLVEIGSTRSTAVASSPADLVQRWQGFLEVEFFEIPTTWTHGHELIVDEALANSFRHGKATKAKVFIDKDGSIEIRDNGQLTSSRKPGMGSSLFSDLAEWNLSKEALETVFRAKIKD